jgi:hypothetical protein
VVTGKIGKVNDRSAPGSPRDGDVVAGLSLQRLRKLLRPLALYYGLWQLVHLALNLVHFFGDPMSSPIRALVGGNMSAEQIRILEASGYIDTVFIVPAGVIFAIGYFWQKRWAVPLGLLSLAGAMYSTYLTFYLHELFGTFVFEPLSFTVGFFSFAPHIILFVLLTVLSMVRGNAWLFQD